MHPNDIADMIGMTLYKTVCKYDLFLQVELCLTVTLIFLQTKPTSGNVYLAYTSGLQRPAQRAMQRGYVPME
jgi:hypothetical protein